MRALLERIFPWLLRRRLAREWRERVNAEILTDNPDEAQHVVVQVGGRIRLVKSGLFARNGDVAYSAEEFRRRGWLR